MLFPAIAARPFLGREKCSISTPSMQLRLQSKTFHTHELLHGYVLIYKRNFRNYIPLYFSRWCCPALWLSWIALRRFKKIILWIDLGEFRNFQTTQRFFSIQGEMRALRVPEVLRGVSCQGLWGHGRLYGRRTIMHVSAVSKTWPRNGRTRGKEREESGKLI